MAPLVTVTYAQSLDGSIAAADGAAVLLSGKEAMHMTHKLRAGHDAILVGAGTARGDDPSLTVRLCPGTNPQPVVLDPRLSLPPGAKLLTSAACERPWLFCTPAAARDARRVQALEAAGAAVVPVGADARGRLALVEVLLELQRRGVHRLPLSSSPKPSVLLPHYYYKVLLHPAAPSSLAAPLARSVMVEGGAAVIQSFLREARPPLALPKNPHARALSHTHSHTLTHTHTPTHTHTYNYKPGHNASPTTHPQP